MGNPQGPHCDAGQCDEAWQPPQVAASACFSVDEIVGFDAGDGGVVRFPYRLEHVPAEDDGGVARRTPRLRASALSHDRARVRVTTWSISSARFLSVIVRPGGAWSRMIRDRTPMWSSSSTTTASSGCFSALTMARAIRSASARKSRASWAF
ncbi:MAG TPA: hypothetical protein VN969_42950 [Streptosporangiaceae bacterium]|nr:hypothetical protein [Streptosporangiaceae bacterium]